MPNNTRPDRALAVAAAVVLAAASLWVRAPVTSAASAGSPIATARDFEFRAEFGLTIDPTAVAAAVAAGPVSQNWGVALTEAEEADLAERVRIQEELPAVRDALMAVPGFGGLQIDQQAGGSVEIFATAASAGRIGALASSIAPRGARLRVRVVPNSLASLQKVKDDVRAELVNKTAAGRRINTIRIELERSVVVVGVDRSTFAATVENLSDRFRGQPVEFEPAEPLEAAACSRSSCSPLRAGLVIGIAGAACTSSFVALAGTNYVLLTAGHCGAFGNTVTHNGVSIGKVTKSAFKDGALADAMMIDIDNAKKSNFVYVTSGEPSRPITSRMALNGDVVGSAVCGSGIKTGFFCGSVTNTDIDGQDAKTHNVIRNLQICTVDVRSGDSGGPMFYGNKAMGIVSLVNGAPHKDPDGVTDVYPNLMFSQIRDVEIQLGVDIYKG